MAKGITLEQFLRSKNGIEIDDAQVLFKKLGFAPVGGTNKHTRWAHKEYPKIDFHLVNAAQHFSNDSYQQVKRALETLGSAEEEKAKKAAKLDVVVSEVHAISFEGHPEYRFYAEIPAELKGGQRDDYVNSLRDRQRPQFEQYQKLYIGLKNYYAFSITVNENDNTIHFISPQLGFSDGPTSYTQRHHDMTYFTSLVIRLTENAEREADRRVEIFTRFEDAGGRIEELEGGKLTLRYNDGKPHVIHGAFIHDTQIPDMQTTTELERGITRLFEAQRTKEELASLRSPNDLSDKGIEAKVALIEIFERKGYGFENLAGKQQEGKEAPLKANMGKQTLQEFLDPALVRIPLVKVKDLETIKDNFVSCIERMHPGPRNGIIRREVLGKFDKCWEAITSEIPDVKRGAFNPEKHDLKSHRIKKPSGAAASRE